MKITMKTFAVMMTAATLALAGCKKEKVEPTTPENPETPVVENVFAGTSWAASVENSGTITEQGYNIPFHVVYDVSFDFLDSVNLEYYNAIAVDYPGLPVPPQNMDFTWEGSYSYAGGDTLMVYLNWEDEETGETGVDTAAMFYDKVAKTLTQDIGDDPDMVEILGVNKLVFTQVDLTAKTTIPGSKPTSAKMNWRKMMAKVLHAINK